MGRGALLLVLGVLCALGCGGESPPAFIPPGVDGGGIDGASGDGGEVSDAALADGEVPDGGSDSGVGPLTGDLCESHLAGISCAVAEIAAASGHVVARFNDGSVRVRSFGPAAEELNPYAFVDLGGPARSIDASCALLENGRMVCWVDPFGNVTEVMPESAVPAVQVAAGLPGREPGRWVLLENGVLRRWVGADWYGYSAHDFRLPSPIKSFGLGLKYDPFIHVAQVCALGTNNRLYCWGDETTWGDLGSGDRIERDPDPSLPHVDFGQDVDIVQVAKSPRTTCVILRDGTLKCWGANSFGQLGLGDLRGRGSEPGEIAALQAVPIGPVRQVAIAEAWGCAVLVDGRVKCWGDNGFGRLGTGDRKNWGNEQTAGDAPYVNLGTGRRALQVAVSNTGTRSCALLDDHSVKCWGVGIGDVPEEMGDALPRVDFGTYSVAELAVLAPQVTVISPAPTSDPLVDQVHLDDTLGVTCGVEASVESQQAVDDTSIVVRLRSAQGNVLAEALGARTSASTFSATLVGLLSVPSGAHFVECEAFDTGTPPRRGRASVPFLHDSGPIIEVIRPLPGDVVGQLENIVIEVDVSAAELGVSDPDAAVTDQEFSVAGHVFAAVSTGTPGRYRVTVDPRSSVFTSPLSGPTLFTVRATNARGVTATLESQLVVDAAGPTVVIGPKHDNGRLVRGVQEMDITVTDALAGVDSTAGFGRIGSYTFPLTLEAGTKYRGVFDTLRFDRTVSQLTIEIHAFDLVGNETIVTRSIQLDNQPPILSLDPPDVREFKNGVTPGAYFCSAPFDPVGSDSISDGDVAPAGAEFRVRVEDETNGLQGEGVLTYLALVDPARARIYMQSDQTAPILIDTNGDGTCDEVNDRVTPRLRNLVPITPAGKSHYSASAATDGLDPSWPSWCDAGAETAAPALLCPATSPLTRVIKAGVLGQTVPAIYGLAPANTVSCVGDSWDWRSQFPLGGPVCVVARAEDTLGNIGVSVPLRVCLQATGSGAFDCAADLSWQNHDCLSGTYDGASVQCDPPPDYPFDFVREDSPR